MSSWVSFYSKAMLAKFKTRQIPPFLLKTYMLDLGIEIRELSESGSRESGFEHLVVRRDVSSAQDIGLKV